MEEGQKPEEENIIKLPKPDKESETSKKNKFIVFYSL